MTEPRRILLIEGDADLGALLAMALELEGLHVRCVSDADSAKDSIAQWRPDAIVSSLVMPDMDAFELLGWLRDAPEPSVPVWILTRWANADVRQRLLDEGVREVLFKPVKISDLLARLRQM